MQSIVLNPGVKEMLLNDAKDFMKSEKVTVPCQSACWFVLLIGAFLIHSGMQTAVFRSAAVTYYTVSLGLGSLL